jgi:1-acyl-sn-glycerol-3-phosphate acyltransferase
MSARRPPASVYLRSSAYWAVFAVTTIVFGLVIGTIGWLLPSAWSYALARTYCWLNMHALRLICGLRWRLHGAEHIPATPHIFFAKHQSTWETMALVMLLPPQVHVIKRELLKVPFFGWGHATLRPIAIDRAAGRAAVTQVATQGRERLASGWCVMIFPEGTRLLPGAEARYRMGGAILASESGVAVIPVAHNAGEFWPRHSFVKWPGTIDVVIGPPIDTAGQSPEAINTAVRAWMDSTMTAIERRGPAAGDTG